MLDYLSQKSLFLNNRDLSGQTVYNLKFNMSNNARQHISCISIHRANDINSTIGDSIYESNSFLM